MQLESTLLEKRQGIVAYALCFRHIDDDNYQLAYGWANPSTSACSYTVEDAYLNIQTNDPCPPIDEDEGLSYRVFNKPAPLTDLLRDYPEELEISTDDAYIFFLDKDNSVIKIVPFNEGNFEDTLKKYL